MRSLSYPTNFRPIPGTVYTAGYTNGDYTIVGVESKDKNPSLAPGNVFSYTDTISDLQHGKTYYYEAWQGNGARYSSGSVVLKVKPVAVTISQSTSAVPGAQYVLISNVGVIDIEGGSVGNNQRKNCSIQSCVAWYDAGAGSIAETYYARGSSPSTKITGWTGCNGAGADKNSCPLSISSDTTIFLWWYYTGGIGL